VPDVISYAWRGSVADEELVDLVVSHGGTPRIGWRQVSAHSLGWVSARDRGGLLVGFVNVAWDGGDHAFLLDTQVRDNHQHRGIGGELVRRAVVNARAAGCEWLHVDFEPQFSRFYFDACGFRRTDAGLVHLSTVISTE
jgi:GNAT superfamily N-acetyltransferase